MVEKIKEALNTSSSSSDSEGDDLADLDKIIQPAVAAKGVSLNKVTQKQVEMSNVNFDRESKAKRIIVVLDEVSLEIARTKRGVELINCDEHAKFITKIKKRPEDFRPDITH